MEKGGLGEALAGAGVTTETVLGFADEMRVGLRGMVRRVWGRRGVKVRQRVQLVYEWRYLFLWWTDVVGSCCGTSLNGFNGLRHDRRWSAGVGWREDTAVGWCVVGLTSQPAYSPELIAVFEEVRVREHRSVNPICVSWSHPGRVRSLAGWDCRGSSRVYHPTMRPAQTEMVLRGDDVEDWCSESRVRSVNEFEDLRNRAVSIDFPPCHGYIGPSD